MIAIIERQFHEISSKTHHRNLDASARDLKILKKLSTGSSVVPFDSH